MKLKISYTPNHLEKAPKAIYGGFDYKPKPQFHGGMFMGVPVDKQEVQMSFN